MFKLKYNNKDPPQTTIINCVNSFSLFQHGSRGGLSPLRANQN